MKKIVVGGMAVLLLMVAAVGIVLADDSGQGVKNDGFKAVQGQEVRSEQQALLTLEEAIQIAVGEVDGIVTDVEFERNKRRSTYEIEIHKDQKEYEVKIDAVSGEIVKIKQDWDDDDDKIFGIKYDTEVISVERATEIARNTVDGRVTDIELDEDDGRLIYEIELRVAGAEAEVEIDALTGNVLSVEYDD